MLEMVSTADDCVACSASMSVAICLRCVVTAAAAPSRAYCMERSSALLAMVMRCDCMASNHEWWLVGQWRCSVKLSTVPTDTIIICYNDPSRHGNSLGCLPKDFHLVTCNR